MLTLNNCIDRAALLAEATVDTLGHVNIVTSSPAASVFTLLGLNCNSLGRANGFAEPASNAALFTGGITAQGVLSTETRGDGAFFEGIVDRVPVMH